MDMKMMMLAVAFMMGMVLKDMLVGLVVKVKDKLKELLDKLI